MWKIPNINDKSVDGVLGSRVQGGRMEGADESTELWWHPKVSFKFGNRFKNIRLDRMISWTKQGELEPMQSAKMNQLLICYSPEPTIE